MIFRRGHTKKGAYFDSDWQICQLVVASTHHSSIATTQDFTVFNFRLLNLLVALTRFQVHTALPVNPHSFLRYYDPFVRSEKNDKRLVVFTFEERIPWEARSN